MKLILVRHGETDANKRGLIQGVSAAPLNELGLAQAEAAARAVEFEAPFALYASPLLRAAQTAAAIARRAGIEPVTESGLIEMDVGEFDGLTGRELRERFPDVMRRWDENAFYTALPGGESLSNVRDRAWRTIQTLAQRHESDTVVAVTHNFTIQMIVCATLDMPPNGFRRLKVDLGSITRMDVNTGRTALVSLNETMHLRHVHGGRPGD